MDEEIWGFLAFAALYGCLVLLFVGALRARKGASFWASRALFVGATLMLVGGSSLALFALIAWAGEAGTSFFAILGIAYFVILGGILVYLIGFLGFCARWGATGRRRAELLEITTALAAANEQIRRNTSNINPLSSETP